MTNTSGKLSLTDFSEALAHTVSTTGRHVVRVEARRRGNSSGIAWTREGLVLTAHHTVQRSRDLRIGLPGGEVVSAELVGRDETTDLAVLHAEGAELEPPEWVQDLDGLRVGHLALSVGRHDAHPQASMGIVAKKEGPWRTQTGGTIDAYLQTDIGVYPGFSGSVLVDAAGRPYGMNTSWFGRRSSLAIPHKTLLETAQLLIEHGQIRRGFLGVGAYPAPLPPAAAETVDQDTGLLIASVEAESPAAEAGLVVGDIIVALGNQATPRLPDLMALLTGERIGQPAPLQIIRGGEVREMRVTVGERT